MSKMILLAMLSISCSGNNGKLFKESVEECRTFAQGMCVDLGFYDNKECRLAFAYRCSDEDAKAAEAFCRESKDKNCDLSWK